jgi:hypothetical protein
MINNLCPPCNIEDSNVNKKSNIKWVKYKKTSDNAKELLDDVLTKNCQSNFYNEYVMADPKNPTDRFDQKEYDQTVKALLEEEPLVPPDVD